MEVFGGDRKRCAGMCSMRMNRNRREMQNRSDTGGAGRGGTEDLTSWRTERLARTARSSRSYRDATMVVVYSFEPPVLEKCWSITIWCSTRAAVTNCWLPFFLGSGAQYSQTFIAHMFLLLHMNWMFNALTGRCR